MSCLYSSPEVTSVELLVLKSIALKLQALKLRALNCRRHRRLVRSGTPHARPDRSAVRFHTDFLPSIAVNKDAFPNSPADRTGCLKSFRLPKQAQVFHVIFQAQYQAFVRFAVGSSAALKPSRSNGPAFWNLSLGAGSRSENSGLHP